MLRRVQSGIIMGLLVGWTALAPQGRWCGDAVACRAAENGTDDLTPAALAGPERNPDRRSVEGLVALLPNSVVAAAILYPDQFFNSSIIQRLPAELLARQLREQFGLDFRSVQLAISFVEAMDGESLGRGIILRTGDQVAWKQTPPAILSRTVFGELHGAPYRRGRGAFDLSVYQLDESTLILATDRTLRRLVSPIGRPDPRHLLRSQLTAGLKKGLDLHLVADVARFGHALSLSDASDEPPTAAMASFEELLDGTAHFELRVRVCRQLAIGLQMVAAEGHVGHDLQGRFLDWVAALNGAPVSPASFEEPTLHAETGAPIAAAPIPAVADSQSEVRTYLARALETFFAEQPFQIAGKRLQMAYQGDEPSQLTACAAIVMLFRPAMEVVDEWFGLHSTSASNHRLSARDQG